MARLPEADNAIIDAEKLYGYVLSETHPTGRFKAAFFRKLGYSADDWKTFEKHLREVILSQEVVKTETTAYGQKFVIEGAVASPSGNEVQIVTVWVVLRGENIPRFVTAYPRER